ncbi:hypothetical protein H5410_045200 [Solanum commersonii]|uniref:Leucine-rich repeat-containing N-terminal plant-type domain-containing protein n=1 Tax=Solanum commersonii TaxID=4109 RepID=A0A9J5XBZ5_SOLCO|nr:hypothetical protein H5410_045200 [Solanum commersonii]
MDLLDTLLQILLGNEIFLVSSQCLDDQKSLLLQLKGSFQYDSTLSNKLARWNQNRTECCNWDGVTCDLSGHVIALELDNQTISSGIENASALFSLQYLERLNLAYNKFNVSIPVGIGNLTNLKYLNLSNAGFVGQIPMMLSSLTRLVTLDLSTLFPDFNQPLKLENPNLSHFIENSTELRELYLDGVDLSAQRTEWCQSLSSYLPNLTVLSLRTCRISGPIDKSLSKLHFLSFIRLDQNNLSTTVPEYFANFSSMTTLKLASCNLRGTFPERIFQVPVLESLDLSNNELLLGSIPIFLPNGSLRRIILSYTNFSGSLPESISNLQNLSSGPIPSTMANLTNLAYLDLSFNNFTGSIPHFQRSKKLTHLDLSRNGLTGLLSRAHFEGLSELVYINLGDNSLNGTLPAYIFELPSLQQLFLNNNQFVGQVDEFRNASSSPLDTVDLRNNHLNGSIPKSAFEIGRLKVLSLSSNSFRGILPLDLIGRLSNLSRLELSYNNLTVDASSRNSASFTFPQLNILKLASCRLQKFPNLKNQSRLIHLDLSDNQIRGAIPNWIWGIGSGNLAHLNLSFNQLEYMEQPYNASSNLVVLDLHSNRLKGDLPIPPSTAIYVDYSKLKPAPSFQDDSYDWQFIFTGVGYGVGAAISIAPLLFYKQGNKYFDKHMERMLKLMFPRYGFSYTRFDPGKVVAVEHYEDETPDDTEDDDEGGKDASLGRYCVFCSKLDFQRKEAMHDPKCTCHMSSSPNSFPPTTSSSSPLLVIYHKKF